MSGSLFFKLGFFLLWPILLIAVIVLSKKHRKKTGRGRSLFNH